MGGRFDTIRVRILIGLALLLAGLIATAIAGAATLRQMRYAIEQELGALRTSTEAGWMCASSSGSMSGVSPPPRLMLTTLACWSAAAHCIPAMIHESAQP